MFFYLTNVALDPTPMPITRGRGNTRGYRQVSRRDFDAQQPL